jgi:hypothetical protein
MIVYFGQFFDNYRKRPNFWATFIHGKNYVLGNFDQTWFWLQFWLFFSQTHLFTLIAARSEKKKNFSAPRRFGVRRRIEHSPTEANSPADLQSVSRPQLTGSRLESILCNRIGRNLLLKSVNSKFICT